MSSVVHPDDEGFEHLRFGVLRAYESTRRTILENSQNASVASTTLSSTVESDHRRVLQHHDLSN